VLDHLLPKVSKNQVSKCDAFGPASGWCERVFAGPHGEEESANDYVCRVVVLVGAELPAMRELEQTSEELGSDGFLATGWGVNVVESFEEGSEGWPKLGAVLDVNGALFETTPERRSQVACGSPQS
jgi:hypothetical protein